jgi:hypothetical protein
MHTRTTDNLPRSHADRVHTQTVPRSSTEQCFKQLQLPDQWLGGSALQVGDAGQWHTSPVQHSTTL